MQFAKRKASQIQIIIRRGNQKIGIKIKQIERRENIKTWISNLAKGHLRIIVIQKAFILIKKTNL